MILSIGLMVKNEEKYLDKCLSAILPIINEVESEIIVVDTGSTDDTVEIAQKYTEKVYSHEWNNNFADMRNIVLSYCTGDWFMFIDADEIVEDVIEVVNFFKTKNYNEYNTATIIIKNYTDSKDDSSYTVNVLNRLFKKDYNLKFVGKIHEQIIAKAPIKNLNAVFNHYGYIADDSELMERKYQRNLILLNNEVEKNPNNIYMKYQLAVCYAMHNENNKALDILKELYIKMNINQKREFKYVITSYIRMLLVTNNFKDCENICNKDLRLIKEDSQYKIDVLYYLANSQLIQKKYLQSIENFKSYMRTLELFKSGQIIKDSTITTYTSNYTNLALVNIIKCHYELEQYYEAIKESIKLKSTKEITEVFEHIIRAFIKINDYKGLYKYYIENIINCSEEQKEIFKINLENIKFNLSDEENKEIEEQFKKSNNEYGTLNKIRSSDIENEDYILDFVNKSDINTKAFYYGDIVYIFLIKKYNIAILSKYIDYSSLRNFIDYCNKKYKDFNEIVIEYIDNNNNDDFETARINIILINNILKSLEDKTKFFELFNLYVSYGIKFIKYIYSDYMLNNQLFFEAKNKEHEFFMHMNKAEELKIKDKALYIRTLKDALRCYPEMKTGIEGILKEIKQSENCRNVKIESLRKQLIDNIKILISCNKIDDAKLVISQYEEFIGVDSELLELKFEYSINI